MLLVRTELVQQQYNLPADVLSSGLVLTFEKRLKTILFVRAFADYITHLEQVPLNLRTLWRYIN